MWDRKHSRDRGDTEEQRTAARAKSAVLRKQSRGSKVQKLGLRQASVRDKPVPELKVTQLFIPELVGKPEQASASEELP